MCYCNTHCFQAFFLFGSQTFLWGVCHPGVTNNSLSRWRSRGVEKCNLFFTARAGFSAMRKQSAGPMRVSLACWGICQKRNNHSSLTAGKGWAFSWSKVKPGTDKHLGKLQPMELAFAKLEATENTIWYPWAPFVPNRGMLCLEEVIIIIIIKQNTAVVFFTFSSWVCPSGHGFVQ